MKISMIKIPFAAVVLFSVAACANKSDEIAASFVSPTPYQSLTCQQLAAEAQLVANRASAATAAQDKKASNDAVATGVGVVLFWPALFFIKGDGSQAAEVGRLKGEMQAIETANTAKNCGIRFAT